MTLEETRKEDPSSDRTQQQPKQQVHSNNDESLPSQRKRNTKRGKGQLVPVQEIFKVERYRPHVSNQFRPHNKAQQRPKFAQLIEKFWQTGSRIYLRPDCPQVQKLLTSKEEVVEWEYVVGVDVACEKPLVCPICLEEATVCPRITKCGHVLCWTCTLRLFSSEYFARQTGGDNSRKCPLCSDTITREDLRPARFQQVEQLSRNDRNKTWTFVHIIRSKKSNSLYCPLAHMAPSWNYTYTPFDRIVICDDPLTFWRKEFISLFCQKRLCLEFKHSPELTTVTIEACDYLEAQLDGHISGLSRQLENEAEELIRVRKEAKPFYAEYEILSEIATTIPQPWDLSDWRHSVDDIKHYVMSNVEDSCPENLHLSDACIQESIQASEFYHFFQSWDGQLKFLTPPFLKLFLHNAGNDWHRLPPCIPDSRLLTCNRYVLDHAISTRYPFLSHLPKGIPIEFYDIVPIHILTHETSMVYQGYLENILKNYKLEERRRVAQDKKYEKHVRESESRKRAVDAQRSQSMSPHAGDGGAYNDIKELDVVTNFPTLSAAPTTPVSMKSIQKTSQGPLQSFRDRLRHGDLDIEEYPELAPKIPPTAPPAASPRPSNASSVNDPFPGNWRTGGPMIHRDPARTTNLLAAKARARITKQVNMPTMEASRTSTTRSEGDIFSLQNTDFPSLSR